MRIELNNNKGKIVCGMKELRSIVANFAIRVPGAFYSPAFQSRRWDGKQKFVSESGFFQAGLLPQVLDYVKKEFNEEPKIIDFRDVDLSHKEVDRIGDFKFRDNQKGAIEAVAKNRVGNIYFPRGIIAASTNAGKTLIALGIYRAFKKKKTILLLNNKTLYDQFLKELEGVLGPELGRIDSKQISIKGFTLAMVPTIISRIDSLSNELLKFEIAIVDECHQVTSASYKKVINKLYNTVVRVGMSGSALKHKDKIKNQSVREFFGDVIYNIESKELEKLGHSSPITVRISKGNTKVKCPKDYPKEYEMGIIKNKSRNKRIINRVIKCLKKNRYPIMIVIKNHEHINQLMDLIPKNYKADFLIKAIHHKTKNRFEILDEFKKGEVDVLISSMIIKTGQNMPLMKAMINAGGGDSVINTLQLLGRAKRKHESKKRTWYYDYWDEGYYLRRHSYHRRNVFISEGHTVIDSYKK